MKPHITPQSIFNTLIDFQAELEKHKIIIPELDIRIEDLKECLFEIFAKECCERKCDEGDHCKPKDHNEVA